MKQKKSSMLKRVAVWVLLLIIGGILWYLLARHQFHKRAREDNFLHWHYMDSMFYEPMDDFRHRERRMENMFNDMGREFQKQEKEMRDNRSDFEDLKGLQWDSKSNWAFHYYQRTNKNWEESSYNINGKWDDWEEWWSITISGTNIDWKDFSYLWTIHDGKSKWTLVDEDGNSRDLNFEQLDLREIYNDSNNLSE